ncbi:MAG: STAS domain-containing protein [Treponema sp.]|jgi:anti-anti-sigma factor|nr:STAS domain-containing protein [Treponema sp.]
MNQLALIEKIGANYVLLELSGDLNAYTISELQEKISRYIPDTNVVLDMSAVMTVDSSGVSVVLAGINDGNEFGTKLFIMNPSEAAHSALTRTGFWNTFNIIHSVTEVSDFSE